MLTVVISYEFLRRILSEVSTEICTDIRSKVNHELTLDVGQIGMDDGLNI